MSKGVHEGVIQSIKDSVFVDPNKYVWSKVASSKSKLAVALKESIEGLKYNAWPLMLPRAQDGETWWYGAAFEQRGHAELGEQLRAFAGPTYSDFDGRRSKLDPSDPIESFLESMFGSRVFKLKGPQPQLDERMAQLLRVRMKSVRREAFEYMPVHRRLQWFESALAAGRREEARDVLAKLESKRQLDPVNFQFLKVRLYSAFEDWSAIVHLENFDYLTAVRRPVAVSQAILRALYHVKFKPFEQMGEPQKAVDLFREVVKAKYPGLFCAREGLRDQEVLKLFMMDAVGPPPRVDLRDSLLQLSTEPEGGFLASLGRLVEEDGPLEDRSTLALLDAEAGRFESAVASAEKIPDPIRKAEVLLEAAVESPSPEPVTKASRAIKELTESEQEALSAGIASTVLQEVGGGTELPDLSGWAAWFKYASNECVRRSQATQFAADGSATWTAEDIVADPEGFKNEFENLLNSRADLLRVAFPLLTQTLVSDPGFPCKDISGVYEICRLALMTEFMCGTASDIALCSFLTEPALVFGARGGDYRSLLDDAESAFTQYEAAKCIEAWLDFVDLFLGYPAPEAKDKAARRSFVAKVLFKALGYVDAGRADKCLSPVLRSMATEIGLPELLPERVETEERSNPLANLSGVIGIYSLTSGVGERVKTILEIEAPDADVRLSSEYVGGPELKSLAQAARVMVVCTRSAKHAATNFIEANLTQGCELIRPDGKGSSSIVRALAKHAKSLNLSNAKA